MLFPPSFLFLLGRSGREMVCGGLLPYFSVGVLYVVPNSVRFHRVPTIDLVHFLARDGTQHIEFPGRVFSVQPIDDLLPVSPVSPPCLFRAIRRVVTFHAASSATACAMQHP